LAWVVAAFFVLNQTLTPVLEWPADISQSDIL